MGPGSSIQIFFSAPYDPQPPEGAEAPSLIGRVRLFFKLRFFVNDGERNYKGEPGFIPHLTILYLGHEQASTFTSIRLFVW